MVKRGLLGLMLLGCCLILSGCLTIVGAVILGGSNDSVSKDAIREYVTAHVEALEAFPYDQCAAAASDEVRLACIRGALGQDTIVTSVYRYDPHVAEFYCGGTGNVSSSVYCGFYYSETDEPHALEFQNEARLTQTADGVYQWSDDNGKSVETERILPHWFYYRLVWD